MYTCICTYVFMYIVYLLKWRRHCKKSMIYITAHTWKRIHKSKNSDQCKAHLLGQWCAGRNAISLQYPFVNHPPIIKSSMIWSQGISLLSTSSTVTWSIHSSVQDSQHGAGNMFLVWYNSLLHPTLQMMFFFSCNGH